ncbi:MAG: glycosyltransferase family 10 domain-containing protein [Fluviibacter sp.]
MKKIKISYIGFWKGFNAKGSFLEKAFSQNFVVEEIKNPFNADVIVVSCFLSKIQKIVLKRLRGRIIIYFSGEAHDFDPSNFTLYITPRITEEDNHFRLPLWQLYVDYNIDKPTPNLETGISKWHLTNIQKLSGPQDAASIVMSNYNFSRYELIAGLRKVMTVDIYGRFSRPVSNKMNVIANYKFNLCPENMLLPGYITEKALQAKAAGCIPLWYGDPSYIMDFSKNSIINMYEYQMNFERMFDSVDINEVLETPLQSNSISYEPNLADFLNLNILV